MASPAKAESATTAATTSGTVAKVSGRRMHFPYTLSAQIAQYPYRFHYEKSPVVKYFMIGILLSIPMFWKIQKMARSPENIKKWDEIHEHQLHHPKPWEE